MSYTEYMKGKGLSHTTISSYKKATGFYLSWLKQQSIKPEQARYGDVLAYMKTCQHRGIKQLTLERYVFGAKLYYDYLIAQGKMKTNPALSIKVQGVKRKTLYHILEPHELHAVYHRYEARTWSEKKNKVIIGLLVYQGLKTTELDKLEVKDVKLKEGKIEIPGSKRSSGRILQLEAHQVLEMYDYVMQVRPEILKKTGQQTNKLLVSLEGGSKFRPDYLMEQLRAQSQSSGPKITSIQQLRASVIVKWLRQYNLREAQYLAGHVRISSTEAYKQSEMEGLTEEVNLYHPLG